MATTLPVVSTPVKRPWVCSGVKSRETPLSVTYWHSSTPDAAAESTLRVSIGEKEVSDATSTKQLQKEK
jgi:hypothetical protein